MTYLEKTSDTLKEAGIQVTDGEGLPRYIRTTDWDNYNFRWTEPEETHKQALDSLRIILWAHNQAAFEMTTSGTENELFDPETLKATSRLVQRLSREASQPNTQFNKNNQLASLITEKGTVQESKHYGLLIHQIRQFERIVRTMLPLEPIANEIQEMTDELRHDLGLQAQQEVHQLREKSREVDEISAYGSQSDRANILERLMQENDGPESEGYAGPEDENADGEAIGFGAREEGASTSASYSETSEGNPGNEFSSFSEKTEKTKAPTRRFSREREAAPEFSRVALPAEAMDEPLKDLPATKRFVSEKGLLLIQQFKDKNLELPTRGATKENARNDVGAILSKLHRRIVDTNPDYKLEALEPDDDSRLEMISEQIAFGIAQTCKELGIPYKEFTTEWEKLRGVEASQGNPDAPRTYEDAVWEISKNLESKGLLPEGLTKARVVSHFVANGGACVERSEAVNIKKDATRQLLDNVIAKIHTGAEIPKITGQMLTVLRGEEVPTGSSRSIRRELGSELERIIKTPELQANSGLSKEELKTAADAIRQLGSLHINGEEPLLSWEHLEKGIEVTLKALGSLPKGSGDPELGTTYVLGSRMPLFPPGHTLVQTLDFLCKADPEFRQLKNKEIGEIHQTTKALSDGLQNPGYYAQKAANLPKADIERQIHKAEAGIELLTKLERPDARPRLARAIQEMAQSPSGSQEEGKLWMGLASIVGFSQSRETIKLYGLPRQMQQEICLMAKQPKAHKPEQAKRLALHVANRICNWAQDPDLDKRPFKLKDTLKKMKEQLLLTYEIDPKTARDSIVRARATKEKLQEQVPVLILDLVSNTLETYGTDKTQMTARKGIEEKKKDTSSHSI